MTRQRAATPSRVSKSVQAVATGSRRTKPAAGRRIDRAGRAQSHLRDKYKALVARDLVNTTEQFIERAATESSLSGEPYQVRCNGSAPVTTNRWMRDRLAHFRTF